MASSSITVRIRVAWWLHWYVGSVAMFARLPGMEPDPVKVEYWVRRACRVQVVH